MDWLSLLIGLVAGVLIGAVAAWSLGRTQARDSLGIVRQQIEEKDREILRLRQLYDDERFEHAGLKTTLTEREKNLAELQAFVEGSKKELANAFAALSRDALASSNEEFLRLAKTRLETLLTDGKGDLGQRQQAIENLVKPLDVALKHYAQQVQNLETTREGAYAGLVEQVRSLMSVADGLRQETGNLGLALRAPQARGRWGELTLRRVAEMAGMVEHCDFDEQQTVSSDGQTQRPDLKIHLPGGREIVVDSKVPLLAYWDAMNATTAEERATHLKRHAGHVRKHMKDLSAARYWDQFRQSPDFVVMFIPGESYLPAALEIDRTLIEEAIQNKVLLASPTMLVALLRTVAMGWRQEQLAQNAADISRLGAQLYDRISVFAEHFRKVGRSFEQAIQSYNEAVGSLETRLIGSARKLKELGATTQPDIPDVTPIDRQPRRLQSDLLPTGTGESF